MKHLYKTRLGGASVTIRVPHKRSDCNPYIDKAECEKALNCSLSKICDSIRRIDAITPRCDFVLEGANLFADLKLLQNILDAIPSTHSIYINTGFVESSLQPAEKILDFAERNMQRVVCLNISSDLQRSFPETDLLLFSRLLTKLRFVSVLYGDYSLSRLIDYLDRCPKIPHATILLRLDHAVITPENLCEEHGDMILRDLKCTAVYRGKDACRVRCSHYFDYNGIPVTYRKTLANTTVTESDSRTGKKFDVVYDIVINQCGDIQLGWNGQRLDVDAYKNTVFEPYDLKWIERSKVKRMETPLSAYRFRLSQYV